MAPLDVQNWLEEVSADAPAGPNLEFDAQFGALERAAQGKPEQQVGDTVIPGEEPDWKDVAAQAAELLQRSRDLRVAGHLAVALLHLRGLPGYAEALSVVSALLHGRWDEVHPQLDPEDDNDPTLRANALLRLADPAWVMRTLRDLPLAASPRVGKVSWRDIALATGALEPEPGQQKQTESAIRGAFSESDPARLAVLREAAAAAVRDIAAIPAAFDQRAGPGSGPDFTALQKLLREIQRGMERFAPLAAADAEAGAVAEAGADEAAAVIQFPAAGAAPVGGGGVASLTAVTSRADALRLLDLVCQYYARNEPSSPLPLLIERARRLADKSFLDILRDLAPDGLSQFKVIAGDPEAGRDD